MKHFMKCLYLFVALLLFCNLSSCARKSEATDVTANHTSNTVKEQSDTDPTLSDDSIPSDSVRFRVLTTDGKPVVGAEMGCTSPMINGERNDDYCIMGTTDDTGCLLWIGELGDIDFDVSVPNQKVVHFNRIIKQEDFGTEIVFTVK